MPRRIYYADSDYQPDFGRPWVPLPPREFLKALPEDQFQRYYKARKQLIEDAERNPVGMGWTLPMWRKVMENWSKYNIHVVLGGNQSSKSIFGSRLTLSCAAAIPEAECYCFHITEKRSIDDQQRFIYEALPLSLKNLPTKKGIHHSLQYTQKNGFTDGIAILPPHPNFQRGGSIKFYHYGQYQQNDQITEGIKAHMIWLDEKAPLALVDTLRYGRLFTYHGRMLLTYTVIDGWNDTIEKILSKTRTLEWRQCDHPKIRAKLPIVQESLSMDSCCIYYFWTDDNPFTDPAEFWKLNASSDKATILARAFGVPTKSVVSAFPNFSEANIVKHEDLPFIKKPSYPVTRYMAIDPGGSKHWFMVWVAIDAGGTWWVYREWPDYDDWALSGNKAGPAQKGTGKGIKDYVDLIRDMEEGESIYERIIDPRMGAAERQTQDGATTIISDLDDCDIVAIPAPGGGSDSKSEIQDGLQLINNLLAYNPDKPMDSTNTPRLYVNERCQNTIFSLKDYTGKLGNDEATKDPIDVLRYLRKANCQYFPPVPDKPHQTGVY